VEEGEVGRVQRRGALILFVAMVKSFIREAVMGGTFCRTNVL
jgi:hypothetical protein